MPWPPRLRTWTWATEVAGITALYDACVLYPAPLRDLLMRLALTDLFRAKWTNELHAEWVENALRNNARLSRERLERTRELMNAHVRDALVEGYEFLIPVLRLPDANDRHLVAAAIHARADVIVTFNLKDFPDSALKPFHLQAQHPDDFIRHLLELNPAAVVTAAQKARAALRNPPKSAEDYLATLEAQSLPKTVAALRPFAAVL